MMMWTKRQKCVEMGSFRGLEFPVFSCIGHEESNKRLKGFSSTHGYMYECFLVLWRMDVLRACVVTRDVVGSSLLWGMWMTRSSSCLGQNDQG